MLNVSIFSSGKKKKGGKKTWVVAINTFLLEMPFSFTDWAVRISLQICLLQAGKGRRCIYRCLLSEGHLNCPDYGKNYFEDMAYLQLIYLNEILLRWSNDYRHAIGSLKHLSEGIKT